MGTFVLNKPWLEMNEIGRVIIKSCSPNSIFKQEKISERQKIILGNENYHGKLKIAAF